VQGWKKIYYTNDPKKQEEVAIFRSDKVDFKPKSVRRNQEGHFILIKGSIHQEEITTINLYTPNVRAHKVH
jgi:hypothetical protein